jgi:hypothetical protein
MRIENDILIPELGRLIAEGKEVRFTPSGVSMRPFIEGDRDSVILAPVVASPRIGDVILAQVETLCGRQTYVLHRLVRIEHDERGELYVLMGDGNLCGEEHCRRDDIIGRVKKIENPRGRCKPLTRGRIWYRLRPVRRWLLKIYRHTALPIYRITDKKQKEQ